MMTSSSTPSAPSCSTVLLIDDNPKDLQKWSSALSDCSHRYSILQASTVKWGLALCWLHKVDCIVTDLDLRETSGLQVLFDLIPDPTHPQVAVIILSRLEYSSLQEVTAMNGAQAYLVKQYISAEILDRAIQKAVASIAALR
jgi:DNA-binding NarL/FixJ family response regulator